MNIKNMRIVLPARMSSSAQLDARMIAEAAARALNSATGTATTGSTTTGASGPITVQVQGQGRPASFISHSVFQETSRQLSHQSGGQARSGKRED